MIRALLLALAASPAAADPALLDFMGGQGCTIGADSRAAAIAAGFDDAAIDALAETAMAANDAYREGPYIVLERQICTIRLPDITSRYTVASPEIVAITSAIDAYAAEGAPGCFLKDLAKVFDDLNGGVEGAGFRDFFDFTAAAILAGDVRFFGPDRLKTPVSFQVVTGACADVPEIAAIRANRSVMKQQFGEYVRQLGERTVCGDRFDTTWTSALSDLLQGADATFPGDPPPSHYNAWMWMEYYVITAAAGWREGMSSTAPGTPRPPLCHYLPEG